jgi:hypothetical protein
LKIGRSNKKVIGVQCLKKTAKKTAEYVMWEKNQGGLGKGIDGNIPKDGLGIIDLGFEALEAEPPSVRCDHPCFQHLYGFIWVVVDVQVKTARESKQAPSICSSEDEPQTKQASVCT